MSFLRHRLPFALLLTSSLGVATFACGGISDPTLGGDERVASVSGALTGSAVPANARVALVYRLPQSGAGTIPVEVGSDVPVIGGKFTMNLGVPSSSYFFDIDPDEVDIVNNGTSSSDPPPPLETAPSPGPDPAPAPSGGGGGGFAGKGNVSTRDLVGGGITAQLQVAAAGFVVYADTNGNGKLDLEGQYASSSDEILGGNPELLLTYFKDGGALDYEKMRDKSGVLPTAGFNLAWVEGRWLPLNVVELKLGKNALPTPICALGENAAGGSSGGAPNTDTPTPEDPPTADGGRGPYPSPTDPAVHCAPDGRSYYTSGTTTTCPPAEPPPVGLCAPAGYDNLVGCTGGGYGSSLPPGEPIPAGWPCPVADGGVVDGGSADGGGADDGGGAFDAGAP